MIIRRIFRFSWVFAAMLAVCTVNACLIWGNYDVETLSLLNHSSRNIYYQYFLISDDAEKPGAFWTIGQTLNAHTEGDHWIKSAQGEKADIIKVMIIDADSRKLLAKIAGKTFRNGLVLDKRIEQNWDGAVTYYHYRFTITDALLEESAVNAPIP